MDAADSEDQLTAIKEHDQTIEKLEKLLSTDNALSKIIFVPGATDPQAHFKDQEE